MIHHQDVIHHRDVYITPPFARTLFILLCLPYTGTLKRYFTLWLTLYSIDIHFENIVGKGEIARYEQFLLFPQCFLLNHISVIVSPFIHVFDIKSVFAAELEEPKTGIIRARVNS